MDITSYIESGILEEYCLGGLSEGEQAHLFEMMALYPELKTELNHIELAIEKLITSSAVEPALGVKQRLFNSLGFEMTDRLDINNLPAVDITAQLETWFNTLAHLIPDDPQEDFIAHLLRKDEYYQQVLVVTKADVPEEEHGDLIESFFILNGRCECTIGTETHQLGPGDFLEIPMNIKHDIRMLTPHVVGILQYQFM